ncbi:MAG: formimidoylglutamate deiminase [Burkholderiales bacterium]|nr:formimidoylglutamate deiminase [Burkholderiales bacterium]
MTAPRATGAHTAHERCQALWAPQAWTGAGAAQGWARDVLLEIDGAGRWASVHTGVPAAQAAARGAMVLAGPVMPGVINAHSHAFQRAFAGLAERRENEHDDFWSWRDRMYRVALSVSPDALRAIATRLYTELLRGGYTHVCEFHYLHHSLDGAEYDDPLLMAWTLADAAADAGIRLTLLPVLYERAGFALPRLRDDQRRFATDARWVLNAQRRLADAFSGEGAPLNAGVAIHSLRAATPEGIAELAQSADGPIHIHVAEQTAEVEDCLKHTGLRPVEWLLRQHALDPRWQLVHATHVTREEIDGVAASGACAVICPTTEANLGDGLTDVAAWLDAGTALAMGSDSHVTRDWREELRLLEYGQRLQRRARNIAASPAAQQPATAERLFSRMVTGSAAAAGQHAWGLVPGARADAVLVRYDDDALLGVPPTRLLDAMVFSSPSRRFADVLVAGRWALRAGSHPRDDAIAGAFRRAMHELWPES